MSLKTKPLTGTKLRDFEAKRDLAAELLESVKQMKAERPRLSFHPQLKRENVRVCHNRNSPGF